MPLPKGHNPNRPKSGSSIKVEPIRTKTAIENIKKILRDEDVLNLLIRYPICQAKEYPDDGGTR